MHDQIIRRYAVMIGGNLVIGLGVGLFKLSSMGNDPFSAMGMAFSDKAGMDFSIAYIGASALCFAVEFLLGRHYIGVGTIVNWFGVGPVATLLVNMATKCGTIPSGLISRLAVMAAGMLILSLGASLYQTADLGISPYDSLALIFEKKTPIPYFWCRICTDSICALTAFLLGGLVGLGTLVCALGLGPFISFFNRYVSEKLCKNKEK